jgi:hypothetical protein
MGLILARFAFRLYAAKLRLKFRGVFCLLNRCWLFQFIQRRNNSLLFLLCCLNLQIPTVREMICTPVGFVGLFIGAYALIMSGAILISPTWINKRFFFLLSISVLFICWKIYGQQYGLQRLVKRQH